MTSTTTTGATITHAGTVEFVDGTYRAAAGTGNWSVGNIPPGIPVGQVLITFDKPLSGPYSVVVTAQRTPDAPMLCANWGDAGPSTFVVVIFDPVATLSYRTVRNGGFSFIVLQ